MEFNEKAVSNRLYDVNLGELFFLLLRKWYFILFSALLTFALMLVLANSCKKKMSTDYVVDPQIVMEITTAEEAAYLESLLSDDALKEISICQERVEKMQELKVYMNDSVLMQIDPFDCKRLTVVYEATSENLAEAKNVTAQYISFATSDESFRDAINEAIGDDEGKYRVSDVITATEETAISQGELNIVRVDFNIVLMPEWDEAAVVNAIQKVVESYSLPSEMEDSSVTFSYLKSSSMTKYYPDIKALQTNIVSQYNNDTALLTNAVKALDRPSALLFNYYLRMDGLESDYKATISEPTAKQLFEIEETRGITGKIADTSYIKVGILGLLGGAFLAVTLMIFIILIRGKAGKILGISVMSDKPLFGIIKSDKLKSDEKKAGLYDTADGIRLCMNRSNIEYVGLICIGVSGTRCIDVAKTLCDKFKGESVNSAKVVCISPSDPERYRILSGLSGSAVLCIAFEKNSIKEVNAVERILSDCHINVLGSVGIE